MAKTKQEITGDQFLLNIGEELRRQAVSPNINGYVPHSKQIDFHTSPARTRLYVGGNRSGKSFGNVAECTYWLTKKHPYRRIPVNDYEPTRGRINAVDFPNGVDKILLPLFKQLIPPSFLINGSWEDSYHRQSRVLTLNNDSFLEFQSYEQDLDKFAGTSRHFVAYDEEPPEVIYTENWARLIDTMGHQWFSMTPVEGMSWVYDKIYLPGKDKKPDDKKYHNTEIEMSDNPHINQEAIDEFLEDVDDANEKEARKSGRFIEMGGLIYKGFDPKPGGLHVIDRTNLRIPKNVPVGISLDHGYNNPTALLWHAIFPEGKIITFHERYVSGCVVKEHAAAVHEFNRVNGITPSILIADPSIRNTDPITGTSIQQEYAKFGLPFSLANNDVKAGINKVNAYLKPRAGGRPLWQCTVNCEYTIKEHARYKWATYTSQKLNKRYNVREEPHKLNDHTCDSNRYFLMSRPNLENVFSDEIASIVPMTERYPDAVRNTGDFTVKKILNAESRESGAFSEYIDGDDMGGAW